MPTRSRSHTGAAGGAVVSALLIGAGVLALWDTASYVDLDSAVFPRTVAGAMILACLATIFRWFLGRATPVPEQPKGSARRRALLVAIMLAGSLAMPYVGFLPAAAVAFAALLLIAMYDPWTRYRMIVYPLVGIAVVFGFYYLFSELLLVPLPTATLFLDQAGR